MKEIKYRIGLPFDITPLDKFSVEIGIEQLQCGFFGKYTSIISLFGLGKDFNQWIYTIIHENLHNIIFNDIYPIDNNEHQENIVESLIGKDWFEFKKLYKT